MAINAYTGLMGSGKSYEAVESVVIPAVEKGRRVVTNIDGINGDLIRQYLVDKKKVDINKLGTVLHVANDDVTKPGFFPDEHKPEIDSVVKPGDLVVIDEAWRFWETKSNISPEHMQFFRMHRHYVHPDTGVACDVALLLQSVTDLHRTVRAVLEVTARTTKLKTLGLNKQYRIELYEGSKITKASRFQYFVKSYKKEIFPLYQSYSGGSGNEKAIDARQNILKNPRLWIIAALLFVMCFFSYWYLKRFFSGETLKAKSGDASSIVTANSVGTVSSNQSKPVVTDALRVAGTVYLSGHSYVVLADAAGRMRFESPDRFVGEGSFIVGTVEGQKVATWTGGVVTEKDKQK